MNYIYMDGHHDLIGTDRRSKSPMFASVFILSEYVLDDICSK